MPRLINAVASAGVLVACFASWTAVAATPPSPASAPSTAAAPQQRSLAVLSVTRAAGIPTTELNNVKESLLAALDATDRFKVTSPTDVFSRMTAAQKKQATACKDDTACVCRLGEELGFDLVALADISRLGSKTAITLKVFDIGTSTVLVRAQQVVQSDDGVPTATQALAATVERRSTADIAAAASPAGVAALKEALHAVANPSTKDASDAPAAQPAKTEPPAMAAKQEPPPAPAAKPPPVEPAPAEQSVPVAAAAAAPPPPPAAHAPPPLAVQPHDTVLGLVAISAGKGFTDDELAAIEDRLLADLVASGRFKVVPGTEIDSLMSTEATRQALHCQDDAPCLSAIAGALGLDYIATADVFRLDKTTYISARVIDARAVVAYPRAQEMIKSKDAMPAAVQALTTDLVHGIWPDLAAVAAAGDTEAAKPPSPVFHKPMTVTHALGWAAAAVGVAALAGAVGLGVMVGQQQKSLKATPQPGAQALSELNTVNGQAIGADVLYGAGGLLTAAGVGLLVAF